jgi:hypothetical protein
MIALLARLEAICAFLRTEGGLPGVVPYQAKLSVAVRATLGRAVPGVLGIVAQFCLPSPLRVWWLVFAHD